MTIVNDYLTGLKQAYDSHSLDYWSNFENRIHGASDDDIAKLKAKFPFIPQSLIELLQFVDGTHWREYQGKKRIFYMFGLVSNDFNYPCYLNSCEKMLNECSKLSFFKDCVNRELDLDFEIAVDDRIIDDFDKVNWLHFSDCMNEGGTVQIYIDFSPSETGKVGQVLMYLHDPDELTVIADSFDEYLQTLMDAKFAFLERYVTDKVYWD